MEEKEIDVPLWWKQKSLQKLKRLYKRRNALPTFFVGAGLSRAASLPSWRELLLELARTYDRHDTDGTTEVEIADILSGGRPAAYLQAGSHLREKLDQKDNTLWRRSLTTIFGHPRLKTAETPAHKSLAQLECSRLITTNYDCLLEYTAARAGRQLEVCHPWKENRQNIETSKNCPLLKLHGDVSDPESKLILTREDYEALYGENLDQVADLPYLQTFFRTAVPLVFIGFSLDDVFVKRYFQFAMRHKEAGNVFAIVPRNENASHFTTRGQEPKANQGIELIYYCPEEGHNELPGLLDYIGDNHGLGREIQRKQQIRRPTVVMIYCGGTIGSKPIGDRQLGLDKKVSRFDLQLRKFSDQLVEWCTLPHTPGESAGDVTDIEWELLEPEDQEFSENATPALWEALRDKLIELDYKYFQTPARLGGRNRIDEQELWSLFQKERRQFRQTFQDAEDLSEKEFLNGLARRYILGFVVLTGTDTLSFTAAALHLGLSRLPCPIVVTGANHPPDTTASSAYARIAVRSDSWRNLSTAFYFLKTFGHRLTEVFVAFGDTVNHAVNLRKRSVDAIPFSRDVLVSRYQEPFMFRNLSFRSEYMFKFIDGVFCNNFYPRNELPYATLSREKGAFEHFRHVRFDGIRGDSVPLAKTRRFSASIVSVQVSPLFPLISVDHLVEQGQAKVVLVEGYASGTYPSKSTSAFSQFLYDLYVNAVPVVLISLYGIAPSQQEYECYKINGESIRVLRLYGIIPETALPLLSLAMSGIDNKEWNVTAGYYQRLDMLEVALRDYLRICPGLLSRELQHVIDREDLFFNLHQQELHAAETEQRKGEFFSGRRRFSLELLDRASSQINQKVDYEKMTLFMFREDYLKIMEELAVGPFEKIGIGPEGFQGLGVVGFKLGHAVTKAQAGGGEYRRQMPGGFGLFSARGRQERDRMVRVVSGLLADIVKMLRIAGFADVELDEIGVENVTGASHFLYTDRNSIGFSASITRHSTNAAEGERFAAQSYSPEDARLFSDLRNARAESDAGEAVWERYEELIETTWQSSTRGIDWFIAGILRGVVAAIGQSLRINNLAVHAVKQDRNDWQRLLSEAAKFRIDVADDIRCCLTVVFR